MCGIVTISFKLWFSGPPFCLVNLAMLVLRSKIAPALKVFRSKHEPSLAQAPPGKMDLPKVRGAEQGHACLSASGRAYVCESLKRLLHNY